MKTTVHQMLKARGAVSGMRFPGGLAYRDLRELRHIRDTLEKELRVATEAQDALVDRLGGKVQNDGQIKFQTVEKADEFAREWQRALDTEIDIDLNPLDLSRYADTVVFADIDADLEALSKFVKLEQEENYAG